jgi:hypothetical protein
MEALLCEEGWETPAREPTRERSLTSASVGSLVLLERATPDEDVTDYLQDLVARQDRLMAPAGGSNAGPSVGMTRAWLSEVRLFAILMANPGSTHTISPQTVSIASWMSVVGEYMGTDPRMGSREG